MGLFSGRRRYVTAGLLVGALVAGAIGVTRLSLGDDIPGPDRFWFMGPLSPSRSGASSSMKPIALELRTAQQKITKLSIPRAYISAVSEPDKELQSMITLVVYLPDYLPWAAAEKAGHRTQGKSINGFRLRSPDEIAIHVQSSSRGLQGKTIDSIKGRSISGGEYKPGLGIYYHRTFPAGSTEPVPDKFSGYLIPAGQDDLYLNFSASPKTGKMVGYSLHFNLNDDIRIQAQVPAEHLDEYEQIRKAVTELVNRFLI